MWTLTRIKLDETHFKSYLKSSKTFRRSEIHQISLAVKNWQILLFSAPFPLISKWNKIWQNMKSLKFWFLKYDNHLIKTICWIIIFECNPNSIESIQNMVQLAFFAFLRSKAYTFSSLHSCHYYDIFMQNILENELSLMTSQSEFFRILSTLVSN